MAECVHILFALKPIEGSFTGNIVKWGCGGLNIDGTRIAYLNNTDKFWKHSSGKIATGGFNPDYVGSSTKGKDTPTEVNSLGRFPANLMFAHCDNCKTNECNENCPVKILGEQSGIRKAGGKVLGTEPSHTGETGIYGTYGRVKYEPFDDLGTAARFFKNFGGKNG